MQLRVAGVVVGRRGSRLHWQLHLHHGGERGWRRGARREPGMLGGARSQCELGGNFAGREVGHQRVGRHDRKDLGRGDRGAGEGVRGAVGGRCVVREGVCGGLGFGAIGHKSFSNAF